MTSSDTSLTTLDVIVIGAGHNGLTAAALLAAKGRNVTVLEASDGTGGAARGDEFHPGFRSGGLAHIVNRLDPEVAALLKKSGRAITGDTAPTTLLSETLGNVTLGGAYGETIEGVDAGEGLAFRALRKKLLFQASLLKRFLRRPPPQMGAIDRGDLMSFAGAGISLLSRGREEGRDFLRMLLMNVADVADEYLTDDRLKGLLAFDATLGIHLGPRSPTSLLGLYYRLTGEANGLAGAQIIPDGGIGGLSAAFENAALSAGATILKNARVTRILADRGVTTGVELADGRVLTAPVIVSAIHPQTTFLGLCDPAELGTGFLRGIRNIRSKGNVAKLDLALDRLPYFSDVTARGLKGRMVFAPSVDHVENAFNPAKYGEFSSDPVMEITLPSLADQTLAPKGAATLSALVQFAPYELKEGWENGRARFRDIVLARLERHAPGIGRSIVASRLMTPADIERAYDMPGGHWHHGELQADQLLVNRPVDQASGYATPLKGLYLASAGAHPGGGLSGLPGLLAARHIMKGDIS